MKYGYTLAVTGVATLLYGTSKVGAEGNELDGVQGYDAVNGAVTEGTGGSVTNAPASTGSSGSTVSDVFKGYNPVTSEQMATGQYYATPIVNIFGNVIGFLMAIVIGWIGVQTAIDLAYWAIPPLRNLLGKQDSQQGGMGMGMGGMGMQQPQKQSKFPFTVSDDMMQAFEAGGTGGGQAQMAGGFGGGFGGGMGGGMGMQQQEARPKHVLTTYFKKRILSVVILGLCMTILFSSILLDTGINLGALGIKLFNMVNDIIVSNT